MGHLKIEVFTDQGSEEPETRFRIPLGVVRSLMKLVPARAVLLLEKEGVDLGGLLERGGALGEPGTLVEVEENGERVVVSVE